MRTDRGGEGRVADREETSSVPEGPHGMEQGGEETSGKRDASQSACIVRTDGRSKGKTHGGGKRVRSLVGQNRQARAGGADSERGKHWQGIDKAERVGGTGKRE